MTSSSIRPAWFTPDKCLHYYFYFIVTPSRAALDPGTRCRVYKGNGNLYLTSLAKMYFILFALAAGA